MDTVAIMALHTPAPSKSRQVRLRRYAAKALTISPSDEHLRRLCERLGAVNFWTKVRARLNRRPNDRKIPD